MKLGVVGLLPEWHAIDRAAAQAVRAAGFKGASIIIGKPLEADPADLRRLKAALDEAGLEAAQSNGWYEVLVHPDLAIRAQGIAGAQALVRIGRFLNAGNVYIRPGSLNPHGPWFAHPDNHTAATFDRLVDSLRQVAATAQTEDLVLALEGHVLSPLDTPERMRAVLDAVGSPALKFNLDVVNFIGSVAAVHDPRPTIERLFALLGPDIAAVHIKDCALEEDLVLHIQEVMLGAGTIDQGLILQRLQAVRPEVYVLIEHLPDDRIPEARAVYWQAAQQAGVPLEV
jgi:sugar phosphate isomerase/epimerase